MNCDDFLSRKYAYRSLANIFNGSEEMRIALGKKTKIIDMMLDYIKELSDQDLLCEIILFF
jgi:hypothetical protein